MTMQTPNKTPKKSRTTSSEAPVKFSSVAPLKVSPIARRLKINAGECSSGSPSSRTPKERSPKFVDRKSPRSQISTEKKRPSKLTELESQISQLKGDLKNVQDQLILSESSKKVAEADAEEVKNKLVAVSSRLEQSQKQLSELLASKEANVDELQNISDEKDQAWQSQLNAVQKQHRVDSDALASALGEIQRLKFQLDTVIDSQGIYSKSRESDDDELQSLKERLSEAFSLVETMRNELDDCKASEAQAQELIKQTLMQLEAAKETVNALSMEGNKTTEDYRNMATELELSRARVTFLEGVVRNLKADLNRANNEIVESDQRVKDGDKSGVQDMLDSELLEAEVEALNSEVGRLRSALQTSDSRHHEAQAHKNSEIRSANDEVDQIMSSDAREAELETELKKAKSDIEELKANLMDKENELQGISEENEGLTMRLERTSSQQGECELENEVKRIRKELGALKSNLMDKDIELQNIVDENEKLKLELINKKGETETDGSTTHNQVPTAAEIEAAKAAERDALTKLGYMMEETDKSNKKAGRVTEQLEAVQAAYAEKEAELRKLKVQSDQWRKAAEAAASMLSPVGNGKFVERTGSLDSGYSPVKGRITSPYFYEDDGYKKNGNMLKKIGVLWKKPQK